MEQQEEVTEKETGFKELREICVHMETEGHHQVYSVGGKEEAGGSNNRKGLLWL